MAKKVRIPTPLRKLTNNEEIVEVDAATIYDAIAELQARYPGFKERLLDDTGAVVGSASTNPDRALALTATAQYDLWKNVISRVELRWDHSLSGERTWGTVDPDTGAGSRRNEWLLAANIIYKF